MCIKRSYSRTIKLTVQFCTIFIRPNLYLISFYNARWIPKVLSSYGIKRSITWNMIHKILYFSTYLLYSVNHTYICEHKLEKKKKKLNSSLVNKLPPQQFLINHMRCFEKKCLCLGTGQSQASQREHRKVDEAEHVNSFFFIQSKIPLKIKFIARENVKNRTTSWDFHTEADSWRQFKLALETVHVHTAYVRELLTSGGETFKSGHMLSERSLNRYKFNWANF